MASRPRAVRTGRAAAQLGTQLAALREEQDLSVDQLAERANLSRATVRRVEGGDPAVGLGTFLTVVKTLGHLNALHAALDPDAFDRTRQLRVELDADPVDVIRQSRDRGFDDDRDDLR